MSTPAVVVEIIAIEATAIVVDVVLPPVAAIDVIVPVPTPLVVAVEDLSGRQARRDRRRRDRGDSGARTAAMVHWTAGRKAIRARPGARTAGGD